MRILILSLLSLVSAIGVAQNCTIGLAAAKEETLIKVFQLRGEQISKLSEYKEKLKIDIQLGEDAIKKLFETAPQDSPEQLLKLQKEYDILEKKVLLNSEKYDSLFLSLLNEKQYQRYVSLCSDANRNPIPKPEKL